MSHTLLTSRVLMRVWQGLRTVALCSWGTQAGSRVCPDSLLLTTSVRTPACDLQQVQRHRSMGGHLHHSEPCSALRRALGAGQNLKEFDIDNKYGANAVKQVLNSILAGTQGHVESAVNTAEVRGRAQQQASEMLSAPCLELCMVSTVLKAIKLAWDHRHSCPRRGSHAQLSTIAAMQLLRYCTMRPACHTCKLVALAHW